MLVTTRKDKGCPPILKVAGDMSHGGAVHLVCGEIASLRRAGFDTVAIDLSHAICRGFAAAFALVEIATREAMSKIAIFSASAPLIDALTHTGMLRFLNIQPDEATALASITSKNAVLTGTKAVILCAGTGTRMSPMSSQFPKPMLDVLGKPVLERLIDHLGGIGIRDIVLNPGHLGHQIPDYFNVATQQSARIEYFPEGNWNGADWVANPIGSASTLVQLRRTYHAISDDVVVLCGDALTDIDIRAMMHQHRSSGAKITVAAKTVPDELVSRYGIIVAQADNQITSFQEKPPIEQALSNLANVGIYIISSDCLDLLPTENDQDIAQDLLARALERGTKMDVFNADFQWHDMGCGKDYFDVVTGCLTNAAPMSPACGVQLRPGLWVHETASVSNNAEISGDCYIGAGSQIAATARIQGPSVIGANCIVDDHALVRNSIVLEQTHVGRGTALSDVIASGSWAAKHRMATNKNAPKDWIPGLSHTGKPEDEITFVKAG